ncbi:hypothetical protein QBC44DRAFT_292297 [Cladorrhinum sp. PSN332]|nr:hypothetical protein QBC44DRAFT_292297 [Cladorrhinum sp. PSN332]
MRSVLVLATLPLAAFAAINGKCSGSAATGKWKESGICVKTSTCRSYGGSYKNEACPNDPADVKCCLVGIVPNAITQPCGPDSWCTWTSNGCVGRWMSNYCPGNSNYKCCNV